MTGVSAEQRCEACNSELVPPARAFNIIVPANADYVCVKWRVFYRWIDNPRRLVRLTHSE